MEMPMYETHLSSCLTPFPFPRDRIDADSVFEAVNDRTLDRNLWS